MTEMGLSVDNVRAGHANMFLSPVFRDAFATVTDTTVELIETDGAEGAARGGGIGAGVFSSRNEAFEGLERISTIGPTPEHGHAYKEAYERWKGLVDMELERLENQ